MCACVHSAYSFVDAHEGQERGSDPWVLELQAVVSCLIQTLRPELRSSA